MTNETNTHVMKNVVVRDTLVPGHTNNISLFFNKISNSYMTHFTRPKNITKLLRKQKKQENILIERTLNYLYKEALRHDDFSTLKKSAEAAGFEKCDIRKLVLIEYIEALQCVEDTFSEDLEKLRKHL